MKKQGFYIDESKVRSAYGIPPAGYLEIAKGLYVHLQKKPCIWHRFWMRVFFGWRWYDSDPWRGEEE